MLPLGDVPGFFDSVGKFFSELASVHWGSLLLAMAFWGINLTLRSRGAFNVIRAAYPRERISWRRIWGAYVAAYGANAFLPARPGDLIRLFLVKSSVSNSSYPTIASSFLVENIFDTAIGVLMLIFALTQGVFPKPPDVSKLGAWELSYAARHPRFTLFVLTLIAILVLAVFAFLSVRVKAFWARVRQGVVIVTEPRRYLRQVVAYQFAGWLCRFVSFWLLLDAFGIGGSVRNVLLVLGVIAVASLIPLAPGGAGVQQAFLVKVFASQAPASAVAAYSVGQQIALGVTSAALGLAALTLIFRLRSFRDAIDRGRSDREAAAAAS